MRSSIHSQEEEQPILVVPRILSIDEWERIAMESQARLVEDAQSDLRHAEQAHQQL